MTTARRILLAASLLSHLSVVLHAEPQPTNVSTQTFVLNLPPDIFSASSAERMVALPDGTRFVLGGGSNNSAALNYLLKIRPDGTQAWVASVVSLFTSEIRGLAADASGNAYIAYTDFSIPGQPHARVVKYSAEGSIAASADLAAAPVGDDGFPFAEGIAVDSTRGRVYADYSFFSSAQGQDTFAVVALDTDLQPVATSVFDPGFTGSNWGPDPLGGIFTDSYGDVWVAVQQVPIGARDIEMAAVHYTPDLAGVSVVARDGNSEEFVAAVDPRGGMVINGDVDAQRQPVLNRVTNGGFGAPFRFAGFDFFAPPMSVDPAGNLYILGFDSNTSFPAVAKVDANNALVWNQPGPHLNLPNAFDPGIGAIAAASSTTFDVAGVSYDLDPSPVVLLHYQQSASAPPANLVLAALSQTSQAGTITKTTPNPLTVKVTDAAGTAVVGAIVTFTINTAPSGATGHGLSVVSALTAQDGTASTILTFGNHVGMYTVTAACAGCAPPSINFTAVAELRLVISLSTGLIRPSGTETAPDQTRTTLLVTAAGISFPNDRVAHYPVVLVSTPVAFSGGHDHDADRPTGNFEVPGNPSVFMADTGMDGSFLLSYVSTATGGQEQIAADSGFDLDVRTTTRTVIVEVPGLVPVPASPSPQKYFLSGGNSRHPANYFASTTTVAGSTTAAVDYFIQTSSAIGINDKSLNSGGLFDTTIAWQPPHRSHRVGTSVDIDRCATGSSGLVLVNQLLLDKLMKSKGGTRIVEKQIVPAPCAPTQNIKRMHYEFIE